VPTISAAIAELARCIQQADSPLGCVTTLVAIDGLGGAGKTSLAAILARELGNVPVVHTDHFVTHEHYFQWGERFLAQVLAPLARGEPACFRPYLWSARGLGEPIVVPGGGLVLIEGVSCSRAEFLSYLAYVVWVDTPRPVRLARGLVRDGSSAREFWREWMAAEDRWLAAEHPRHRADVVVDGTRPYLEGVASGSVKR